MANAVFVCKHGDARPFPDLEIRITIDEPLYIDF